MADISNISHLSDAHGAQYTAALGGLWYHGITTRLALSMVNDVIFEEEKRFGNNDEDDIEEGVDTGEGGIGRSAADIRRLTVVKSPLVPTRELFFRIHTAGLVVVRPLQALS